MKDVLSFLGGALIGAALGAGVVLFSTPQPGPVTRASIKQRWQAALETGKQAARQREQELWAEFNTRVKAPADLPLKERSDAVTL
ncbi:YtxH domain-containing protein [Kallotenue papyrolyticum]|uniref:YtxH domain-containing protein n=1 Tax=Kallotenue papyrolyticum TaxID=1325125 RepID=UPI0004785D41|nr:YtxH domain-containing protein [Kallotenue papyrolyticum]